MGERGVERERERQDGMDDGNHLRSRIRVATVPR